MAEVTEANASSLTELLAAGRRHLAVRDWSSAVETLAKACEQLAKEHGDLADQCAEPYLWYGKSLLGLSREESGVLGDGVPGANNEDDDEDQEENGENENGEAEENEENKEVKETKDNDEEIAEENGETEKNEPKSTTADAEPSKSKADDDDVEPGPSNSNDESVMENEDDVDNLQLAWEMLDLSRNILARRAAQGGDAARALLADVHLALGEVALESETYDKAVLDMQSCLEIQKELYRSDDRRIAETHYQIGLANSLASNFEDAITHFKNAANILESRIRTLENPTAASLDATVKKFTTADPFYSIESEIKELKELLPEIQEKIQDMMDYKAELNFLCA
ncbi:histone-binding protein N1/N2-like isoform X2 [Hyposmocoma kahamanoa]|uniref:histone-binding protein N1/N2-like isoform X2 n=1 Tax=Hyposmocoma kahamanoa TaxID=1477025 RepID=UPI000E6D9D86|nr:histone-binding protein N1/N2-like isoform X2 [Hyposmocoma kahamanoa]